MYMKIKKGIRDAFSVWKDIFKSWKYVLGIIIIGIIFYSINVLIANWQNLTSFYSNFGILGTLKFFVLLFLGFKSLLNTPTFISLIIISVLFGFLFSLIIYKVNLTKSTEGKRFGFLPGIATFFAAFAPGCAACGIGLASALGLSAAFLSFLPFDGLELSILSIGILGFTIGKVTKDLSNPNVCKVNINKVKGGKR